MWKFNPRALHYLNEAARQGSLRKAASRLNIDASAISRQLGQLEEETGRDHTLLMKFERVDRL